MAYASRFYAVQVCCAELDILECRLGRDGSLDIVKSFSLPIEDAYLWKPKYPVYAVLPSNMFFMKQVKVLCPENSTCGFAVEFEYDKNIPFPRPSVHWNYALLDPPAVEGIERDALIFSARVEVVDRWLSTMKGPLELPSGITPYSMAFYNIVRLLNLSQPIRHKDKISIAILCTTAFTDIVIIGESESKDWIRTLPRGYGNVSLIWDIKEILEAYFSKFSGRIGDVALSQDIENIYLLVSQDVEREEKWEELFEKELGIGINSFPLDVVFSAQHFDSSKFSRFALAFGLAVMFSTDRFNSLNGIIPMDTAHKYNATVSHIAIQVLLVSVLVFGMGYLVKNIVLPEEILIKNIQKYFLGYKAIKPQVIKLRKEKEKMLSELSSLNNMLSLQYFYPEVFSVLSGCLESLDSVVVHSVSAKLEEDIQDDKKHIIFSLHVVSDNYDNLNDLLISLRKSGRFLKVSAVNSRYDSDNKVTMLLVLEK